MSSAYRSRITGTGSAFPETRVTNLDLAKRVETSDEWIRERTGIGSRHISRAGVEAERNSSLAALAATRALEMAGKRADEIDVILYATCTPDTLLPSTACWLQKKIGATRAWAMDLNGACSGFVYAAATADQFIRSGQHQTILIVGADVLSAFTNWEDRGSCILFGDAAGAAILERTTASSPHQILSAHLGSDGRMWDYFHIPAGGSNQETTPEMHAAHQDKMHMKGPEMYKVAVRTLTEFAEKALTENGLTARDLDWFVPHQANQRIIEAVAKRLDFPMSKVVLNIERYGNTSSGTVPTALDEAVRDGRIKPGQTVLFDVFGAGLTWGSMLVRW